MSKCSLEAQIEAVGTQVCRLKFRMSAKEINALEQSLATLEGLLRLRNRFIETAENPELDTDATTDALAAVFVQLLSLPVETPA